MKAKVKEGDTLRTRASKECGGKLEEVSLSLYRLTVVKSKSFQSSHCGVNK